MSQTTRKALLIQNLRKLRVTTETESISEDMDVDRHYVVVPIEDLLELMRIVAQEEIYEADQKGFFDHTHSKETGEAR